MYNYDSSGTRWNRGETVLNASNVSKLHEKWRYLTTGDVYATPAVVDNTVYFGDSSGVFYALTSHGQLVWKTKVSGPITASALVTNTMVIFGDQAGYIYGLDRANGSLNWQVHPNPSTIAQIWSSPTWVGTDIVIGIGSFFFRSSIKSSWIQRICGPHRSRYGRRSMADVHGVTFGAAKRVFRGRSLGYANV